MDGGAVSSSLLLTTAAEESRGLQVVETFGPTFQGEGPSAGQQALFVRLGQCNLSCHWCDSRFTWDWKNYDPRREIRRVPAADLAAWALSQDVGLVVITGGEPLLQQHLLIPLVTQLREAGRRVEVETNGTIPPLMELREVVEQFNVSPKLAHAGSTPGRRISRPALIAFQDCGRSVFKFVVAGRSDLDEVHDLVQDCALTPVWIMPAASQSEDMTRRLRDLADEVLSRGWNLSVRLQILLWEDIRGR